MVLTCSVPFKLIPVPRATPNGGDDPTKMPPRVDPDANLSRHIQQLVDSSETLSFAACDAGKSFHESVPDLLDRYVVAVL